MNDLNQLLRDWAERREPTSAESDQMQARIIERLANASRKPPSSVAAASGRPDARASGRVAVVAVAAAAALLAAVTLCWPGWRSESSRPNDLAIESLPASDLAARRALFVELDRMFDGHWLWLGEVNGRVHLQTDDAATDGSVAVNAQRATDSGVVVRLAVVQRRPGATDWRVVWEASVLARSEEWVRLPAELTGDSEVSVWVYSLPDGAVLVESDVALTAPVPVRLSEQQIFGTSLRPARLWSTRRAGGEFQLIQSIARLEAKHG